MIFNLFKSKPTLKELIPKGFVDIHSHILPGIDDGAKNIEESLKLISEMKKLGTSEIIATPHTYPGLYDNQTSDIYDSYKKLKNEKITDIKIKYASEYFLGKYLIQLAEKKSLLSIGKKHVLVEMSMHQETLNLHDIIYNLLTNGYTPILAHPERYMFYHDNIDKLLKLKKIGCKFQLNLLSTVGYYGRNISNSADIMLKKDLFSFVGSDVHNMSHIISHNNKIKSSQIKKIKNLFINHQNNLKLIR